MQFKKERVLAEMQEKMPELYKSLTPKQRNQEAKQRVEKALLMMRDLTQGGLHPSQAEELAREEMIAFPQATPESEKEL